MPRKAQGCSACVKAASYTRQRWPECTADMGSRYRGELTLLPIHT